MVVSIIDHHGWWDEEGCGGKRYTTLHFKTPRDWTHTASRCFPQNFISLYCHLFCVLLSVELVKNLSQHHLPGFIIMKYCFYNATFIKLQFFLSFVWCEQKAFSLLINKFPYNFQHCLSSNINLDSHNCLINIFLFFITFSEFLLFLLRTMCVQNGFERR